MVWRILNFLPFFLVVRNTLHHYPDRPVRGKPAVKKIKD
jgi:hypothetical protein